jgi:hypothetical protein
MPFAATVIFDLSRRIGPAVRPDPTLLKGTICRIRDNSELRTQNYTNSPRHVARTSGVTRLTLFSTRNSRSRRRRRASLHSNP